MMSPRRQLYVRSWQAVAVCFIQLPTYFAVRAQVRSRNRHGMGRRCGVSDSPYEQTNGMNRDTKKRVIFANRDISHESLKSFENPHRN